MNCRPGDRAIIVKATDPRFEWSLGLIVHCKLFIGSMQGQITVAHDAWHTSEFRSPAGVRFHAVRDCCLMPIRDPGDDVPDESTAWLPPVPYPALEGV